MKRIKFFAMLGGFALLAGCFSDPATNSLSSDLVVATDRNLSANFQEYQTYHISDTIPNIGGTGRDSILVGDDALEIVNRIKQNMNERGYTFVERDDNPDIGIIPAILQVQNIGRVCSGWWWGYPGYWGPGYWGYPGYGYYYPYCGYYSYQTGSLALDLIDLKNVDNSGTLNALWSSAMFGALSSSDATNLSRAIKAIDQSFIQSPYIQN
jgi:hypothetical protein